MYLCIDSNGMYVSDAPESALKSMKRLSSVFHYEEIEYCHVECIRSRLVLDRDGRYRDAVVKKAAEFRAQAKQRVSKDMVARLLKTLSPEELDELLKQS